MKNPGDAEKLQGWRDWAADLMETYYGADPFDVAEVRLGSDAAARAYLSYFLGAGVGSDVAQRRDMMVILGMARSIEKIADTALARLDERSRNRIPGTGHGGRNHADPAAGVLEGVEQGPGDGHREAKPKL